MTVRGPETEEADGRPLHERIAADLRDDIMSGDLAPGDSLPSTAQLKERFGAANATVQKALQLLKGEHLVVGRAGASVTVREHRQRTIRPAAYMAPSPAGEPYRWLTEAANSGSRARSTLLDVSEVEPPADVADALALQPGGTAILRYQLLSIDDEPAELVASYYPLDIAEGTAITERRRIPGGTPTPWPRSATRHGSVSTGSRPASRRRSSTDCSGSPATFRSSGPSGWCSATVTDPSRPR